jgi:hypothetical protein
MIPTLELRNSIKGKPEPAAGNGLLFLIQALQLELLKLAG